MARRAPYPARILGTDLVTYAGRATIGSSGAATSYGFGGTIAKSATCVYTITFDEKYPYLQSCVIDHKKAGGGAITKQDKSISYSASTGVLTITFLDVDDGLVGNSDLASGESFDVICVFQTRNVLGQS